MARWRDRLPAGWALLLALLMLGPALLPGYVLSYDMVWVPDLALRTDFLGVGSALPRAVPSDAVVAVLDEVVPGMLLQKVVLLGCLVAAGTGAAALVPRLPVLARCGAVTVAVWNPFVVERLVIGHWPLLVTYAVAPWLLLSVSRWRRGGTGRGWWLLVALGSLSASGGLLTAAVVVAAGAGGRLTRIRWAELLGVLLAGNAPWLLAGALHAGSARVDARSGEVFALSAEGLLPAPLAALSLGGIWNADVVPASREGGLGVAALVVLVGLAVVGITSWSRIDGRGRLAVLWGIGMIGALLTWLAPGMVGRVASTVPGAGVMRDGSRMLLLCAPLLVVLVGHGLARVVGVFAARWQGLVAVGSLAVLPIALMSDAVWGAGGRLVAVEYPSAYETARAAVGGRGDVLVLPFTSYRSFAWNGDRPVLDPLGRYLEPNYVVNDQLSVDGRPLGGEDPRATAVARALERADRGAALAALGIGSVVVDRTARGSVPDLRTAPTLVGPVGVWRLPDAAERTVPEGWWATMSLAWAAFLALILTGAAGWVTRVTARIRYSRVHRWYCSWRSREGTT